MPQPICPSCKQPNDTEMAFCIFCGSTLKPGSISGRKPDVAGDSCQACGKSDPLNGKFCVFCGSQIILPVPEVETPARQRLGDANPSVSIITKAVAPQRSTTAAAPIFLVVLGTALGAALGTGTAWAMKTAPPATKAAIPDGISILTDKPLQDVYLKGAGSKYFVLGFTGSDGNFSYRHPKDDAYQALIDRETVTKQIKVKDDNAVVDLTKAAGAP